MDSVPFFSVVIATRNRPELFRAALGSVRMQSFNDVETIVVDDGSFPEHQSAYKSTIQAAENRVVAFSLPPHPQGHGASFARNFGATKAAGRYLCFLDDDDIWIDPGHLRRAHAVITMSSTPVDLYMANQDAFFDDGQQLPGPIWIEDLASILQQRGNEADHHGSYTVTTDDLLMSHGFCHLNTLTIRRALFDHVGGFDERTGWEEDHDFYLRTIDHAVTMKYVPVTVARHNIPCAAQRRSLTTTYSELERRVSQLRLLDRAILSSRHAAIRAHSRKHKGYVLKLTAERLAKSGRYHESAFYAREALAVGPTIKWLAYTVWLTILATTTAPSDV